MEKQDVFIAVGQALFAILGSCVKWLNLNDKEPQKLKILLAEVAAASFSGFLIYLAYAGLGLNIYLSFALAGIIGNQGAKGIDLIGKILAKNGVLKGLEGLTEKKEEPSPSESSEPEE